MVTEDVLPNMPAPQQPTAYPKPGKERARILLAMKQAVLFNGLADSVLGVLADTAQAVEHAAADVVFHQGEEGVCYFIINEGQVEMIQDPSRMNPGRVPKLRQTRGKRSRRLVWKAFIGLSASRRLLMIMSHIRICLWYGFWTPCLATG